MNKIPFIRVRLLLQGSHTNNCEIWLVLARKMHGRERKYSMHCLFGYKAIGA